MYGESRRVEQIDEGTFMIECVAVRNAAVQNEPADIEKNGLVGAERVVVAVQKGPMVRDIPKRRRAVMCQPGEEDGQCKNRNCPLVRFRIVRGGFRKKNNRTGMGRIGFRHC